MIARAAFIFLLSLFACAISAQTTEEEYQYVAYGYKEQLQKGMDDKKGYYWKPIFQYRFTYQEEKFVKKLTYTGLFDFEGLYLIGETTPRAVVAIFRKEDNMSKKDGVFMCVPHHKSMQGLLTESARYLKEEVRFSENILYHYTIALGSLAMALSEQKQE